MRVGQTVYVYSRTSGRKIPGIVIDISQNRRMVKITTDEGCQWVDTETLAAIEKTVLPND